MSEKVKLKLPKLNLELLKNNWLIAIGVIMVIVFVLNLVVWNAKRKADIRILDLKEKKEKIESVSKKIANFVKAKGYLKTEEFKRKVPFGAIPPIAAIQQVGLIISEFGAYDSVIVTEKVKDKEEDTSNNKDVITVGPKTLQAAEFSFEFHAAYGDFIKILDKLSTVEPLIVIKGFVVERSDNKSDLNSKDLRRLAVELKLSSFAEISPDQGIWVIDRPN